MTVLVSKPVGDNNFCINRTHTRVHQKSCTKGMCFLYPGLNRSGSDLYSPTQYSAHFNERVEL